MKVGQVAWNNFYVLLDSNHEDDDNDMNDKTIKEIYFHQVIGPAQQMSIYSFVSHRRNLVTLPPHGDANDIRGLNERLVARVSISTCIADMNC